MLNFRIVRKIILTILIPTFLASRGKHSSNTAGGELSGVVQAGRMSNADVKVYKTRDGSRNEMVGQTQTDAEGYYSVKVEANSDPVEIVASNGEYTDEATGKRVKMSGDDEMSVVLEDTLTSKSSPVTPITTQVADRVKAQIQSGNVTMSQFASAKDAALQEIAQVYGTDIDTIMAIPGKPESPGASSSTAAKSAFLLATLSQYLKDKNLGADKGVNPFAAMREIAKDFKNDGKIDGKDSGTPVSVTFATLCTGWGSGMSQAIENLKTNKHTEGFKDFDKSAMGIGEFKAEPENKMASISSEGQAQITICHIPPGYTENKLTVTVSQSAVDAHLGHGDYRGACLSSGSDDSGSNPITWTGTKQLIGSNLTEGKSVATDLSGNVFITGYTNGDLDGNQLSGQFSIDCFLTKYNSVGVKQWTKTSGVAGTLTYGEGVTTDSLGNAYIAGDTYGGLDGNTLVGSDDLFVTKYNPAGVKQWTKTLGVLGHYVRSHGIASDSSGNIFISGVTNGGVDGNTLVGLEDFFLTKYDSGGTKHWTKQLGVAGAGTFGMAVATDSSGSIFVAGTSEGNLDGNTRVGFIDLFVTKYNSAGVKQWTKRLGVPSRQTWASGIATDLSGNIFVGGYTRGGLDGNTLVGAQDFFVTKYASDGTKQWTKQLEAWGAYTYGFAVATDLSGNVYVAGETNGALDGIALIGIGGGDFFVTKFNSAGVKQWTTHMGLVARTTTVHGIASNLSGSIFVGGYSNGDYDGNIVAPYMGLQVTKYNSSGIKQ